MSLLEKYDILEAAEGHIYPHILAVEKYIDTIPDISKYLKKLNQ